MPASTSFVSIHQMAPPHTEVADIYRPQKRWKAESAWLADLKRTVYPHISGHPSAAGRAQDMESSPVKDQRSTAVPRNQIMNTCYMIRLVEMTWKLLHVTVFLLGSDVDWRKVLDEFARHDQYTEWQTPGQGHFLESSRSVGKVVSNSVSGYFIF